MGSCWNCGREVSLTKEQTKCDGCKTTLYYCCNNCKEEFIIEDEAGKLKECKLCGYFICPHCSVCFYGCKKYKWQDEIMRILAPEFSFTKYPILKEKISKIMNYLEYAKTSNERKECINHIPITYAKGRIKSLMAKLDGFRVKNQKDRDAFVKRIDELSEKGVGFTTTISKIREEGSYGQEYRDAFNLLVCFGKMKITWIPATKDKPEYALYERINGVPCPNLFKESLVIYECKKCKKTFDKSIVRCPNCPPYKKGKEEGQLRRITSRLNNIDTCQMYRGEFS